MKTLFFIIFLLGGQWAFASNLNCVIDGQKIVAEYIGLSVDDYRKVEFTRGISFGDGAAYMEVIGYFVSDEVSPSGMGCFYKVDFYNWEGCVEQGGYGVEFVPSMVTPLCG